MLSKLFRCLVIGLAAVIFGPQDVFACSCAALSFAKTYELSTNVFTAVITSERTERISDYSTLVRHAFTVTGAFKGHQSFSALVTEGSDIVSCGTPLKVGAEYLFFMRDSGQVGVCPGPLPKESAGPEIAALEAFATERRSELVEPWHLQLLRGGLLFAHPLQSGRRQWCGIGDIQRAEAGIYFSRVRPGAGRYWYGRRSARP